MFFMKMLKYRSLIYVKNRIFFIIELFFMVLFSYSATEKIFNFELWVVKLLKTGFFTISVSYILAIFIPLIEFLIVLFLLFRFKYRYYINFFFTILLTSYLLLHHFFSVSENCSCGGILEKLNFSSHLILNIILLFFAFILIKYNRQTE